MVNSAQRVLDGTSGKVVHATVENWGYPAQAFDLVISRLVLHYVKDIDSIFRQVYQTLTKKGRFVFSIEHPVITSCERRVWIGFDEHQLPGRRKPQIQPTGSRDLQ